MNKPQGIIDIEVADGVFSALAHPARRQILLAVHARGTSKAGEIAQRFKCSWPTISRHLAELVKTGLLKVERNGRERLYSTDAALVRDVLTKWSRYFK